MLAQNIQRIGNINVVADISSFLNQFSSVKTKTEYKRDIEEFFMYLHGLDISKLSKNHIELASIKTGEKLSKRFIIEYRSHLLQKNKNGTVNRKIRSLSSLYKFLESEGYSVNHVIFSLKPLAKKVESYDVLSKDEVMRIAEASLSEKNGKELRACIYTLTVTSIRVSALLNSKWSDIKKIEGTPFYSIEVIDKGDQERKVPIESWLYDMLVECKSKYSDLIFPNMNIKSLNRSIQKLSKIIGINDRRIVTHSLRKVAPTFEMQTTHDVRMGMKQTGHRCVQTFMDYYVDQTFDYNQLAGIKMFKDMDESILENFDKNEILSTLKKINENAYIQLLGALQEKNFSEKVLT